MYMWKVFDAQCPVAWMMWGGAPASAREVAPLARMDWPAISDGKKRRNLHMNQEGVGTVPDIHNQSSGLKGWSVLWEEM